MLEYVTVGVQIKQLQTGLNRRILFNGHSKWKYQQNNNNDYYNSLKSNKLYRAYNDLIILNFT